MTMQTYGDFFPMLYVAWQQELLNGDRRTIEAFLQEGKQLGQHMGLQPYDYSDFGGRSNMSGYALGATSMFCSPVESPFDLLALFGTSGSSDTPDSYISAAGRYAEQQASSPDSIDIPDGHIALMPDTQGNTLCQPGTVAAIPANSKHKEAAARFIEMLLSEAVQTDTQQMGEGFPAIPAYTQAKFEYHNLYWAKNLILKDNPIQLLDHMDCCIPDDPLLEGRILQAAIGYWIGEQTLEQAVEDIYNLLQTMRAEQQ